MATLVVYEAGIVGGTAAPRLVVHEIGVVAAPAYVPPSLLPVQIGSRLTVTNLPATHFGRTQEDVHVQGWVETWTTTSGQFVLDVASADDPAPLIWDDPNYGRFALATPGTVTGGTVSGTGVGAVVVSTSPGDELSTQVADYPCWFDWAGEAVRVAAPPAETASPQTLVIDQRGGYGTVARTHTVGDTWQVWRPGAFTL